mgnify:FL=1|jgi:hypothetical protein
MGFYLTFIFKKLVICKRFIFPQFEVPIGLSNINFNKGKILKLTDL